MHQQWIIGCTERMKQGRSAKKIYADIPGKKPRKNQHDRLGWIARKFIAPMTFTGKGCNTDVFNAWTEQVVLPQVTLWLATVGMDHAAFEKRSAKTKELIESAWLPLALSSHIRSAGSQSHGALLAYHKKLG